MKITVKGNFSFQIKSWTEISVESSTAFCLRSAHMGLPCGLVVNNPTCSTGDTGSTPGQGTKVHKPQSN